MNIKTISGGATALLVAGVLFGNALALGAAPLADSGAEIKAAAAALVATHAPGFTIDHVEIDRWAPNYATARVFPNLQVNETDPAIVILRNDSGTWTGIGGPGTAFPPGDSREGAPDRLFVEGDFYSGANAQNVLAAYNTRLPMFDNGTVKFQYPSGGTITQDGSIKILGPELNQPLPSGGIFEGPSYEISVTPLGVSSNGPLDSWGYDQMMAEWQRRVEAAGPGGRVAPPQYAAFFHADKVDVFQIDWLNGDGTQRVFYATAPGGGAVTKIETPIKVGSDDNAAIVVLNTLQLQQGGPTPGMPSTGGMLEDPLLAIVGVSGLTAVLVGLVLRASRKRQQQL